MIILSFWTEHLESTPTISQTLQNPKLIQDQPENIPLPEIPWLICTAKWGQVGWGRPVILHSVVELCTFACECVCVCVREKESVYVLLYVCTISIKIWLSMLVYIILCTYRMCSEHQTHDQKVASLNPGRSSGRIFFSRVHLVCWLLFGVRSTPHYCSGKKKTPGIWPKVQEAVYT